MGKFDKLNQELVRVNNAQGGPNAAALDDRFQLLNNTLVNTQQEWEDYVARRQQEQEALDEYSHGRGNRSYLREDYGTGSYTEGMDAVKRRRQQQEWEKANADYEAALQEYNKAAETTRRVSAVAGPVGPEKQREIDAAKSTEQSLKEQLDALKATADKLKVNDSGFTDWEGRDALVKEYRQLQTELEHQSRRSPERLARFDEVKRQLQEGDRAAGNKAADYSVRDRSASIFGGAAKRIAGGVANTALTAVDLMEKYSPYMDVAKAVNNRFGSMSPNPAQHRAGMDRLYAAADSISDSAAKDLDRAKTGLGKLGQAGVDIAENVLEMGFDAAVGALTGGGSLVSMFARVFGDSAREARQQGATLEQQVGYGVAAGGIEVLTEKLFDGVAGIYGKGAADNITETVIRRLSSTPTGQTLLRGLIGAINEGNEEVLSDLLNPLAQAIYRDDSLGQLYREVDPAEVLYDFLIGAAVGGLGSVTSAATGQDAAKNAENNYITALYEQSGERPSFGREVRDRAILERQMTNQDAYNAANLSTKENAQEAMRALRGQQTETARAQELQQAQETMRQQDADSLVSAVFSGSGITLDENQRGRIMETLNDSKAGVKDFAIGTRDAYNMGEQGATMEETVQAIGEKYGLSPKQARTAWSFGASNAQTTATGTADIGTEEGRTKVESALSFLGDRTDEAVKLYDSRQDVGRMATAMNKAVLYAAHGADVQKAVQNAREGKAADVVGVLTDEQAQLAQEIGAERRARQQAADKALGESYREMRQKSAAITGGATVSAQALEAVDTAIDATRKAGQRVMDEFNELYNALEALEKADPNAKNSEPYKEMLDRAYKLRDKAQEAQKQIRELEKRKAQIEGRKTIQRKKGTVSFGGGTVEGVKYDGVDTAKLSRQQQKVVAMVERLADAVNLDYVFISADPGMGGAYTFGGRVYININAGLGVGDFSQTMAAASLSHEMTHWMQQYAPEEYSQLKDFIVQEILKADPQKLQTLIQQQKEWEKGRALTDEQALDEVVANACQTMLLDSKAINKLARQNMSLAARIADWIADWSQKVKDAFAEVDTSQGAIYEAVRALDGSLDRIQELWDNGIEAAAQNYDAQQTTQEANVAQKATNENAAPESSVKYQKQDDSETRSIKQQIQVHAAELNRKPVVSSVRVSDMPSRDIQKQRKWVEARLRNTGYAVERKGFGKIEFTPSQINTGLNYLNDSGEIAAFAALPAVIKRGDIIDRHESHKGRQRGSVTIAAPVEINGVRGNMAVALTQTTRTHYHTHRILMPDGSTFIFTNENDAELTPAGELPAKQALIAEPISSTSEASIADDLKNGNGKDSLRDSAKKENTTKRITALEGKAPRTVSPGDVSTDNIADALKNSKPQFQQFQRWDDTTDDTAAEANDRELAYTRLQSENKVLSDTIKALNKTISKRDSTIEKLQTRLHLTKAQETREADARKLARALIRDNGSKADMASVTAEIKALSDYILQTDTDKVSEEEIKSRARRVAAEILENASEQIPMEDEQLAKVRESIKGKKLTISPDFIGELDGGFDSFRKRNRGKFILASAASTSIDRTEYTSVSQFYADMQSEYGKAYFPDLANEGEEAQALASIMQTADPLEINPFEKYMGEATEELANRITMDALGGVLRVKPPTDADKAKTRNAALREQILELRKEQKLADKEAASLYNTIYDLSVALDRAESKYKSLQISADRRMTQVRAEGAARAVEIKAAERARSAEKIANLKEHYQDMQRSARQRRENTGTRRKIRKLIDELNARLKNPTEKRHIPRELVQQTIDVLRMIDLDNGLSESLTERLAKIRTMYEGYQKNPTYSVVYDDVTAEMLKNLAETVGDTKLLNMSQAQLDAVYEALKSLNHVIHESINVRIGTEERNAYEVAKEMTAETRQIPTAQKSWARRKYLPAHLRADVAFRRFAGFKKNSAWESMCRVLNDGQLRQTELQMRMSLPFADLVKDEKAIADFTAVNALGKIDKSKLVDIGLKDENGDAIMVSHDIMVGIYMDLLNEDNRRHFIRGGKTVPNLADFYSGKGGFGIGTRRAVGISGELSELYGERREAKGANYGDWTDDVQGRIDALTDAGEQYANQVKAAIEESMTDFDRRWLKATQQLMDVDSKRYLNETTMQVYGIEKARIKNYFPITTDPNFLGGTSFESITRDMSLENAGFMKERVESGKPTLALGVAGVVNDQINRVAQYCGLMPAIRNFNKVYNKIGTGYSDSIRNAVNGVFGEEGTQYIENLIADLTGSRKSRDDVMGLSKALAVLRGNLAQSTLTLNPRVALAQAASYPTAAAELGYGPLAKAFFSGGRSGRMISRADTELIAKYSPLLWYRMQGYSSPEMGDIKSSDRLSSKVFKKLRWFTGWIQAVDGATVGRLWYAAEYWVQDHQPTLQKGTDAYYEAVAEKFNAVVEKTQPNYTTMQRAAILREPDGLIKTFTMFMTQRLQNFNILYDSTAAYQKARADFANKRNGVTQEDVREAKTEMVNAVTSQFAQAAVFTAFKFFADAVLHRLDDYRDDETGELTLESVSLRLLNNYIDAFIGAFLLGSELYGIIKGVTGLDKWYGLSLSGVDSVNDILDSVVKLASETDKEKRGKKLWKLSKDLSVALGLPTTNAEKMYNAVRYHAEDIANGAALSFEAGFDRTTDQKAERLIRALESGDKELIAERSAVFGEEKDAISAVKERLNKDFKNGEQSSEDVEKLLVAAGMDENDAYFSANKLETGDDGKYTGVLRAAFNGDKEAFQKEVQALTSHGIKERDVEDKVKDFVHDLFFEKELSKEQQEIVGDTKITDEQARRLLNSYAGMSVNKAVETVSDWIRDRYFYKKNGWYYSDRKSMYVDGEISRQELRKALMDFGKLTADKADAQIKEYDYDKETGYAWADRKADYQRGDISRANMVNYLMKYGGKSKSVAEAQVTQWDWQNNVNGADNISVEQIEKYNTYCIGVGVSKETFVKATKIYSNTSADLDEKGESIAYSKTRKVFPQINALPISTAQKEALALCFYSQSTVNKYRLW